MPPVRPFVPLLLLLLTAVTGPVLRAEPARITPQEAAERVAAGQAVLVDVREPAEWKDTGVVTTAHTLALSDLRGAREAWRPFLEAHKGVELILYCRTGNRSAQAAALLEAEGHRVANAGGLREWIAAGKATRRHDEPVQAPAPTPDTKTSDPRP